MNDVILEDIQVEHLIYEIRGVQVMLDSDLAKLYCVETGNLNKAMKRNIDKFPQDFCFQLTKDEYNDLLFQNGIAKRRGGRSTMPYVYSELGVSMLSSALKSDVATRVSIKIIRAFIAMRHYIGNNEYRLLNIESKIVEHDSSIKLLQDSFSKFEEKKKINDIYFSKQIYDAYSKIKDIFSLAKEELVIIDSYADKTVLDMIKDLSVKVVLITKHDNKLTSLDIEKYNKQYSNLTVVRSDNYHDRYFILDKKEVYHCGTSINYAGSKVFSINNLQDNIVKEKLIEKVSSYSL